MLGGQVTYLGFTVQVQCNYRQLQPQDVIIAEQTRVTFSCCIGETRVCTPEPASSFVCDRGQ